MAKITLLDPLLIQPVKLMSGHVIPGRGGSLTTTNDVIRGDSWAMLNAMRLANQISIEFDPEPDLDGVTSAETSILPPEPAPEPVQPAPAPEPAPAPATKATT